MVVSHDRWEGSEVTEYDILRLRHTCKILGNIKCRIPKDEVTPVLQPGERVVIAAHFERGFELPMISLFCEFLDFFQMQPHHLGTKAIMLLSAFMTLCEGYLRVRPSLGIWSRIFHFKSQMVATSVK